MVLDKHNKYSKMYHNNTLYWGLGIENELYLEFEKPIIFSREKFINNHKRERYSVDYYSTYKSDSLIKMFNMYTMDDYSLPVLLNSHSFTYTDIMGNSKTLYTKLCEPNPKFIGQTLGQYIHTNDYLKENYEYTYTYDGDTIEFITNNFFNATIDSVINELVDIKHNFITNLQDVLIKLNSTIFNKYGMINYMKTNYPFAVHMTNTNNVSMFNNGTLHINITLPTILINNMIHNIDEFIYIHKKYIRLIQFMEPILITIYGASDPFSEFSNIYSACSQRCAVSRYIGIGTYNTNSMITGKLLTDDINIFNIATESYGWYNMYYKICGYKQLNELGYDINFNKHYHHGVELRFFDHISDINKIREILMFLIYLGDYAMDNIIIENPIYNENWNKFIVECMLDGNNVNINNFIEMYNMIFGCSFNSTDINMLYNDIYNILKEKSKTFSPFSSNAIYNKYIYYV